MDSIIRPFSRMLITGILGLSLVYFSDICSADETMTLISTIILDQEGTHITNMAPAGDFNADGYPDLAVGVIQEIPDLLFEAVYLYYGGPDFDNAPDLILEGEPQNLNSLCDEPYFFPTSFGRQISLLNDFNQDGFNDLAISASEFCTDLIDEGRIYIYFGSPQPDTLPDIIIDGTQHYDYLGQDIGAGDFNGDGLTDLLAIASNIVYRNHRAFIYLGDVRPDSVADWLHEFDDMSMIGNIWYHIGVDLNNDGFGDFGISTIDFADSAALAVFLGDNPLNSEPSFMVEDRFVFTEDISGDDVDDILYGDIESRLHLCLGGDPLDFEPDHYIGPTRPYIAIYTLPYAGRKLVLNDWQNERLIFYNTGVPFDTIPYNIFDYERLSRFRESNIGDINADGTEDLAFGIRNDSFIDTIKIYSIFQTSIEGGEDIPGKLPRDKGTLYCYPNPFNSATTLVVRDFLGDEIEINIYDITGSLVRSLMTVNGKATWDAEDSDGRPLSSGVYFAWGASPNKNIPIKIILIK
jgi:hypothetical protein